MNAPSPLRRAAWLQVACGGLGSFAVAGLLLLLAMVPDATGRTQEMLMPPLLLFAVVLSVPATVAGVAVLCGSAWGPLLLAIVATLQLPLVPFGTAVGGYSLWALRRVGVARRDERAPRLPSPRSSPPRQLSSLLPEPERTGPLLRVMAWVGFGFVAVIAAGFWISGDPVPAVATAIVAPVLAVLSRVLTVARRAEEQHEGESHGTHRERA